MLDRTTELGQQRARMLGILQSETRSRVLNAQPYRTLSTRGNKLVEAVHEPAGYSLTRRSYTPEAVEHFESQSGLSFPEAWKTYQELFTNSGIVVARNVLLRNRPEESKYPYVAAVDFVDGPEGSREAGVSAEAKVDLAAGLGRMVRQARRFWPGLDGFMTDMVKPERLASGGDRFVLIDLDPTLVKSYHLELGSESRDMWMSRYTDQITEVLKYWSTPEDRYQVMSAYIKEVAGVTANEDLPATLMSLSNMHLYAQGVDPRAFSTRF